MPSDEKALKDYNIYNKYLDDSREWREDRDKMMKFAAGAQYSSRNSAKMEARDQVDIVVNKIRPLLKMRTSLMSANKPTGYIYGVHKEDTSNAAVLNDFIDWHWYNSDGQIRLIRTVKGQNTVGVHYLLAYSDNQADYGRGEIKITDVSYRNVFIDKGSREWDFSDAPRMIHTQLVRPEDFYLRHPNISPDAGFLVPNDEVYWDGRAQHKKNIIIGTPRTMDDEEWIRELDVYEKVTKKMDVIVYKNTGRVHKIMNNDDELDSIEKILLKKDFGEQDLINLGVDPNVVDYRNVQLEIKELPIPRIDYRKSISGVKMVGKETLPISSYPLIPIIDEDTGNALPMGEVDHQHGIQQLLNSCVSLTLLNAALGSNLRMLYDPQGLGEMTEDELNERWAVPGAKIPMRRDPVTGQFPVEMVRPEPLNQAWFTLAQMLSNEIEFQISTFSLRTGDPSAAPETFAATLQLGQWAQDILRVPLTYLESGIQKLFNVILEWIPSYYDFEKVFYTIGDHGEPISQTINPQVLSNVSDAFDSLGSIQNIKASYRIRTGSTMPSQSVAELSILQSLAQVNPALLPSVIDRMPGLKDREKEEIKQRLDRVIQLSQENKSLADINNALQKELSNINQQNKAMQTTIALSGMDKAIAVETAKQKEKIRK